MSLQNSVRKVQAHQLVPEFQVLESLVAVLRNAFRTSHKFKQIVAICELVDWNNADPLFLAFDHHPRGERLVQWPEVTMTDDLSEP